MSYVAAAGHAEPELEDQEWDLEYEPLPLAAPPAQAPRSVLIPVMFLLPLILSAVGWLAGGLTLLSDGAMVMVTIMCVTLLFIELLHFGSRQGVGAIVLYGGVLIWFCHDYMFNWFLHDYNTEVLAYPGTTAELIARVAFYHCLFIELMTIGFRLQVFRWVDRLVVGVPEPADERFYLRVVMVFLLFGLTAFFWARDSFIIAILKVPFQLWIGQLDYTVSRTGNLNYNWGGYVAQIIQMGEVGGLLAVVYALMVARTWIGKLFGWAVWVYWTADVIPSGRRGELAFMVMPALALVFIKFHAQAAAQLQRRSLRMLIVIGVLCVCVWAAIARETATRNGEESIHLFRVAGNSMFSEGLRAWKVIPSQVNFANDTFPGASFVRPIPDSLWSLVSGLVPRALWTTKGGMDEFTIWYNSYISGDRRGLETGGVVGTTVSTGAVGYWYFRYGPIGVIEGGLFYGWLLGVCERAVRRANGRPLKLLFALSFATFMFRSYRDLWWHNLDPIILGWIMVALVVRIFFGVSRSESGPMAPPQWALAEPEPAMY